jgi:hypothetical protein
MKVVNILRIWNDSNVFCFQRHAVFSKFLHKQDYAFCPDDDGWLVVLDPVGVVCWPGEWDDVGKRPVFLYSTIDTPVKYASAGILIFTPFV